MRIVQSIKVELISERIYDGNKEFIGTYKIGQKYPIPFRMIQDRNTHELIFEPEILVPQISHLHVIKEEILRQSTII